MKKWFTVCLVILCLVGQVFAGGSSEAADTGSGEEGGGTLRIGINTENVHTMLSFTMTGTSDDYYYSWPVYESLFKPNAEGGVDPWLLESYEMDKDNLTYTFHIRPGITFSDGTPLDAEAMKWNLDHYLEVGAKVAALLSSIESVEVVDDLTVVLHLSTWSSILPYAFSRECGYMYSPTFYQEHGEEYCTQHPCGTGPFVMTEWNYDVSKRFEARDDYWGGPVKLDAVEYIIYTDALVAQAAMQSGELDVYLAPDPETARSMEASGITIKACPVASSTYMLCFNSLNTTGDDPTGDVRVRKAISHAVDWKALVQAVWGDYASYRNQFGVGQHFYSDSVIGYDYDPELSKQLLAEAGYPDGFTIELKTEDSSPLINSATIIQQYLSEVGINAELSVLAGADGNAAEAGWGKGLWVHGSSVYVSAPMQMASMFRQNLSGHVLGLTTLLRPDDVEAALALSVSAATEEEAVAAVGEANRLLTDEYDIITNFAETRGLFAVADYVKDSGIGESFYSVADLANAWLDK